MGRSDFLLRRVGFDRDKCSVGLRDSDRGGVGCSDG